MGKISDDQKEPKLSKIQRFSNGEKILGNFLQLLVLRSADFFVYVSPYSDVGGATAIIK